MFKRKKFNVNERLSILKSFAFVSFKLSSRAVFICCGIDLALIQKYQSQNCMEAWKNIYNSDIFFYLKPFFFFFLAFLRKKQDINPELQDITHNSDFTSHYMFISHNCEGKKS